MPTLSKKYTQVPISTDLFHQIKLAAAESSMSIRHYVEQLINKAMPKAPTEEELITPEIEALVNKAKEESEKGETLRFESVEAMNNWLAAL